MNVISKLDELVPFDKNKLIKAIEKARKRTNESISESEYEEIVESIEKQLVNCDPAPTVKEIHNVVPLVLKLFNKFEVAESYLEYRYLKEHDTARWEKLLDETERIRYRGDVENANFDSSLIPTQCSLIRGEATKELFDKYYLSKTERELTHRGDIYIHDKRDLLMGSINCCLFDMKSVLKGGFVIANRYYKEPKRFKTACDLIGDIILCASACQYGGFTVPEIDKVLFKYARNSYNYWTKVYERNNYVNMAFEKELRDGFECLEYKLNTLSTSRGDYPFTTFTFGEYVNNFKFSDELYIHKAMIKAMLDVRMKGDAKGNIAVFPKLVYLHSYKNVENDIVALEEYKMCLKCSAKCMYPDYLSIDGNQYKNKIAKEYAKYGTIVSPMGCRAFLSHYGDADKESVTVGRCNIGAVSINHCILIHRAKLITNSTDPSVFTPKYFELLNEVMDVIYNFFEKRYEFISSQKCGTNPLAFTQGGFYKGTKKPDECIGDLVKYMTASFGVAGLNEATVLLTGKSIKEDNSVMATKIVETMEKKLEEYKNKSGHLYALYGTPAESYSGTQARQYAEYSGDTQFGSYFTNSFHMHVNEDITPFEKQDLELDLFLKVSGGHIGYARIDDVNNLAGIKAIVDRAMVKGYYYGINFNLCHCNDCGKVFNTSSPLGMTCSCGSKDITVINRVSGYLGYSSVNGKSRINETKMDEIKERKSM